VNKQLTEGYVIVVKELEDVPRYKGMDRTPPVDTEAFQEGFDDPWLAGEYPDESGLLPTLELAQRFLGRYAPAYREELELIYGRIWDRAKVPLDSKGLRFLGFDLAGEDLHFCSAIREYDFGWGSKADAFEGKLNEYGLFKTPEDALAYQKVYTEEKLFLYDAERVIWEVYAVENGSQ
jgi:hypothetical protein